MKEYLTNKEEEIKDIADGMSFEIDTADLWANIEPQLPPVDNNRRRPIWWMMTGVLLGLIVAGSIFVYTSEGSSEITVESEPILVTSKLESSNETSLDDQNTIVSDKSITNKNSINKIESKTNTHTQPHLTSYEDGHNRGRMDNSNTTATNSVVNNITNIHQPSTDTETSKNIITKEATLLLSDVPNKTINKSQEIKTILENRSVIGGISSIKLLELGLLEQLDNLTIPTPSIEPLKINRWKSFWQINTGVNKTNSRITFTDNEVTLDPQFAREQNLIGLSNSIQHGQENKNGWRLFGGISHTRSTSRYSNFDKNITQNIENGVESKTIDKYGNAFETLGDITVTSILQNDIIWHRNHDYINLEVGFGKRHSLINQLSLVTDAFVGYNIWSRNDGYYFEKDNPTITKFTPSETHPYQNKGIDIGGKLGVEYTLGNFSIGLAGNYNHGLGTITKSNNYYQLKNSHYGVQLGVVYRP